MGNISESCDSGENELMFLSAFLSVIRLKIHEKTVLRLPLKCDEAIVEGRARIACQGVASLALKFKARSLTVPPSRPFLG